MAAPTSVPRCGSRRSAPPASCAVPFTSGILIGIGETRRERIEALLALRALHAEHGHLQEIIVQNFRAKPGTAMARRARAVARGASLDDRARAAWCSPPEMSIQAPPNLNPDALDRLLAAGINDWGGVSPVTPDHVNPEAPWPHARAPAARRPRRPARSWSPRLPIYPRYVAGAGALARARRCAPPVLRACRCGGLRARGRLGRRCAGASSPRGTSPQPSGRPDAAGRRILRRARAGHGLEESDVVRLFAARGREVGAVCRAGGRAAPGGQRRAGQLRRQSQHQLHQRLLLPLPLLRVLQGQARRASARPGLRPGPRRDRAPHPRGVAARRDRDVPAGRHPSRLHRRRPISTSAGP